MDSKRRLSNITASTTKLKFDSLNKILKIDSSKSKKQKKEALARQVSKVALAELLKNAPTTNVQDLPDFRTFLSSKENIQIFREFLKTQYCQENIDFYLACEKFQKLDPEKVGKDLVKFMATQIYNDYLGDQARQPVNINYECLKSIRRQICDPNPEMLCQAQLEIYNLMKSDCYPRFCKTWRLDRETAKKILCEHSICSLPLNETSCNTTKTSNITNLNLTSSLCSSKNQSSHRKGVKRKAIDLLSNECPEDCPYFRVGLPCQQHNVEADKRTEQRGTSDLIDKIDLRRIHHVPNCCSRRSPSPPPPLPPKPDELEVSPVINKKFRPYVGKVFHV